MSCTSTPFQVTDEGRKHLEEKADEVETLFERLEDEFAPRERRAEARKVARENTVVANPTRSRSVGNIRYVAPIQRHGTRFGSEERDVQVRGYKIRLPLDVMLVASANPEDYTNRGRIITPLKDRFGSQIRTHYPLEVSTEAG